MKDPFALFPDMTKNEKTAGLALLVAMSPDHDSETKKSAIAVATQIIKEGNRANYGGADIPKPEVLELGPDLLSDFPEIKLLNPIQREKYNSIISSVYSNLRTVERSLPDLSNGKPTINFEYHLRLIVDGLVKLCLSEIPKLDNFIEAATTRLHDIEKTPENSIMNQTIRGRDAVYR